MNDETKTTLQENLPQTDSPESGLQENAPQTTSQENESPENDLQTTPQSPAEQPVRTDLSEGADVPVQEGNAHPDEVNWDGVRQWGEGVWKDVEAAWQRAEQIKDALVNVQDENLDPDGRWSEAAFKWTQAAIDHASALQHTAEQIQESAVRSAQQWGEGAQRMVEDYNRDLASRSRHFEERLQRWQEGARRWAEESERRKQAQVENGAALPVTETAQIEQKEDPNPQNTRLKTQTTDRQDEILTAAAEEVKAPERTADSSLEERQPSAETVRSEHQKRAEAAREQARQRAEAARERALQAKKRAKAEAAEAREAEKQAKAAAREALRSGSATAEAAPTIEERIGEGAEQVRNRIQSMSRWNYNALVALFPSVISVVAFELVAFIVTRIWGPEAVSHPLVGLMMIIPMAFMMERFYFALSASEGKKFKKISEAIHRISDGDYDVELNPAVLVPYAEVADEINDMATQLGSVETLRRDFINNFSHEFKTPITSISGFAHLLLEENVSEEERKEYLQIIADESDRLASFSSNTMMLSRLETQTEIPDQKPYSLDAQVRQAVILLSRQWSEKNIDMDVDLSPLTYTGNADLMMHVWVNLLNNAIKFTPEGRKITVRLEEKNGFAAVSVADTGIGMSREDLQRVFQKYYQADTSHASKGMGLGLSIAWRIAELAGGHIDVESVLGEGSVFTVKLPL